jgi:hypothetical protein
MRLIDADEIYKEIIQNEDLAMDRVVNTNEMIGDRINPMYLRYTAQLGERTMFKYMIMDAPTVDAVPVVRCKDCKFSKAYYHGSESNLGMFTYLCTQGLYGMNADDYCSRAERKEE